MSSDSEDEVRECPQCPYPFVRLPPGTRQVLDADEEIFELYMTVESDDKGGLGYLGKKSEMDITLELEPPESVTAVFQQLSLDTAALNASPGAGAGRKARRSRRDKAATSSAARPPAKVTLDFKIHQDPSGLHSRSGETGTVLWRCSKGLAENMLSSLVYDAAALWIDIRDVAVLELGAGVGLLAAVFGDVARAWTATDYLTENLRLVKRNCAQNADVRKEIQRLVGKHPTEAVSKDRQNQKRDDESTRKAERGRADPRHADAEPLRLPTLTQLDWASVSAQRSAGTAATVPHADLVLGVDCIYNEHLVKPLVDTLATACQNGAVAWVVVELRSSDVLTQFLNTWLQDPSGFTIVRLPRSVMGEWKEGRARWVGWVGWCGSARSATTTAGAGAATASPARPASGASITGRSES